MEFTAKIRCIAVTIVFMLLILSLCAANLLTPDAEISKSERRKLAQLPEITRESILDASLTEDFEEYLLDQFVFRDAFRTMKAYARFQIFRQKDNNDIYIVGDQVYKIEYPLKERQVQYAANRINTLYERYMKDKADMNVYYAIIPDKNYYTAAAHGYPSLDYERMTEIMRTALADMRYIELFDCLAPENYYATDTHWKQPALQGVVTKIAEEMGFADRLSPLSAYTAHRLEPFYGVYYGQSALTLPPDEIVYLTNEAIDAASVYNLETDSEGSVYDLEKFNGMDSYDIFLSGATAFMEITNPLAETERELILFRDSFGSSIAPLFTEAYSKITLIDLRYIAGDALDQFITFDNQDVLFLYSTLVLNSGTMLR